MKLDPSVIIYSGELMIKYDYLNIIYKVKRLIFNYYLINLYN